MWTGSSDVKQWQMRWWGSQSQITVEQVTRDNRKKPKAQVSKEGISNYSAVQSLPGSQQKEDSRNNLKYLSESVHFHILHLCGMCFPVSMLKRADISSRRPLHETPVRRYLNLAQLYSFSSIRNFLSKVTMTMVTSTSDVNGTVLSHLNTSTQL